MSKYFKNGNTYMQANEEMLDMHSLLPVGNYVVKIDPFERFYFERIEAFTKPSKVFGDTEKKIERIFNTFQDRTASTGVLMSGEKGSGKTLLGKLMAIKFAEHNMPTIIINSPFNGDKFNTLIQNIEQPAIIMFDEFEKVYDSKQQESVLTLMDGVFPTKKMFIITCNDRYRIDEHMSNRPGRLFYSLEFEGLEADFIKDYCNHVLNDKSHIKSIINISSTFHAFNFDMLKALVEEMNRYNESAFDSIKMLNAKPLHRDGSVYDIEVTNKGIARPFYPSNFEGNPLAASTIRISVYPPKKVDDVDDVDDVDITLVDCEGEREVEHNITFSDMVSFDGNNGVIIYKQDNLQFKFTKRKFTKFAFDSF